MLLFHLVLKDDKRMLIDHYNYNRLCQHVQGISSQVSSIT